MTINLWFNKEVNQWRWTLTDDTDEIWMESGNAEDLEVAMADVAKTVKFLMSQR